MKNIQTFFKISGLCLIALLIAACPGEFSQGDLPDGMGVITLNLGSAGRTILPEEATDGTFEYVAVFINADDVDDVVEAEMTGGTVTQQLAFGTWDIMIRAFYDDELVGIAELAPVTLSFLNVDQYVDNISVLIKPYNDFATKGTLTYDITYPGDIVDSAMLYITTSDGEFDEEFDLQDPSDTGTLLLAPGSYRFRVELTAEVAGEVRTTGDFEIVHIYPGLTSEVSFSFNKYTLLDPNLAELTAGADVTLADFKATTTQVTFTGASNIDPDETVTADDFVITGSASINDFDVTSDTITLTLKIPANFSTFQKINTVGIATTSFAIKGSATVTVTQPGFDISTDTTTVSNGIIDFEDTETVIAGGGTYGTFFTYSTTGGTFNKVSAGTPASNGFRVDFNNIGGGRNSTIQFTNNSSTVSSSSTVHGIQLDIIPGTAAGGTSHNAVHINSSTGVNLFSYFVRANGTFRYKINANNGYIDDAGTVLVSSVNQTALHTLTVVADTFTNVVNATLVVKETGDIVFDVTGTIPAFTDIGRIYVMGNRAGSNMYHLDSFYDNINLFRFND